MDSQFLDFVPSSVHKESISMKSDLDGVREAITKPDHIKYWFPIPFDFKVELDILEPFSQYPVQGRIGALSLDCVLTTYEIQDALAEFSIQGPVALHFQGAFLERSASLIVASKSAGGIKGGLVYKTVQSILVAGAAKRALQRLDEKASTLNAHQTTQLDYRTTKTLFYGFSRTNV